MPTSWIDVVDPHEQDQKHHFQDSSSRLILKQAETIAQTVSNPTNESDKECDEVCEDEYEIMEVTSPPQQYTHSPLLPRVHDNLEEEEFYIPVATATLPPTQAHSSLVLEDTDNDEVFYVNIGSKHM